ncbi:MAG: thioesterase family protein [Pseudomonadota bacterium]|nr:thioesterase family protein [Pseudomonadota bacterium]
MYEQVNLDEGIEDQSRQPLHKQKLSSWTGTIGEDEFQDHEQVLQCLCDSFNASPFVQLLGLQMQVINGEIQGYLDMRHELIGNTHFRILHGGVTAAVLDSIGGVVAMGEIYRRKEGLIEEQQRKAARLATMDMRVDYLSPGRGQYFIATAEVMRMGRKGCTVRMELDNNEGKAIAIATAVYAY